jgi:hypothetical protein
MTNAKLKLIWCVAFASLLPSLADAAPPGAVDVSPAFQPEGFSGAVGSAFKMTSGATPTDVHQGDRLTLTLRVTARGAWQSPPRRLDLAALPQFKKKQFTIDPHPSTNPDREPGRGVWEFAYVLRPRTTAVHEIPSIPLRYYNPRIAREDRRYPTTWSSAIALTVLPPAVFTTLPSAPLPAAPDRFYAITTGPALLRHDEPFSLSWPVALVTLLLPPALGVGCYVVWRRICPDAARQARRTQSQAAGQALLALRAAKARGPAPAEVASIVTRYLRQRSDLPSPEPTPAEVRVHLGQTGTPPELAARAAQFFCEVDLARFGPQPAPHGGEWTTRAVDLILALEGSVESGPAPPVTGAALVLLLGFAVPLLAGQASSPQEGLARAVTAFNDGVQRRGKPAASACFREAANGFSQLWQQGARNADLCRNEGNAHLLAGNLAGAILAYRHGLLLDPNSKTLRVNLAYARDMVRFSDDGFGRQAVARWPSWLPRLTAGICWSWLSLAYGAVCLALTGWWMTRRRWLWGATLAAAVLTLVPAVGLAVELGKDRCEAAHPAVVVAADSVWLRQGNGTAYPPRAETPLHAGVEARVLYERGDWIQVELSRGEVGWLPRSVVLVDEH